MEWWLIDALAVVGLVGGGRLMLTKRRAHRADAEELAGVRTLADEDVTQLGEELGRLDGAVGRLDQDGRADYQRALDAYETAQRAVPRMRTRDEIEDVSETLSEGRYALACVDARLQGRPLPPHRVPCFLNPQHGPSTEDVLYTASGRGTRTVPACAQDAARVRQGEKPEIRKVKVGTRMVPYWEAGATYLPYTHGYFVAADTLGGASLGWAYDPSMATDFSGGGYVHGDHGGFDGGGFGDGGLGDGGGFGDGGGGGDGGGF
jgi:hypothetical protein